MKIEVSNGEIIDKYTILAIKLIEIKEADKLKNIQYEYHVLTPVVEHIYALVSDKKHLKNLHNDLLEINKKLWNIENNIREHEKTKDFGEVFIKLARAVYFTNDSRSIVKKRINQFTESDLTEEKAYEDYK